GQLALERLGGRVAHEGGEHHASRIGAEHDLHAELARERDEAEQSHDRDSQRQGRRVAHQLGDDEGQAVRTRALRQPCRADGRQQKQHDEQRLMQMLVRLRQRHGGEDHGAKLAEGRGAEDVAAELALKLAALAKDRDQNAESRRGQDDADKQRRAQQSYGIKQRDENDCDAERGQPGKRAEAERLEADPLRIELQTRLEEEINEPELAQKSDGALARNQIESPRTDQYAQYELQNDERRARESRHTLQTRRDRGGQHDEKKRAHVIHGLHTFRLKSSSARNSGEAAPTA